MKPYKINELAVGTTLVFAGLLAIYFEFYKHNQVIEICSILLLVIGWGCIYNNVTKRINIYGQKVAFSANALKWIIQTFSRFLGGFILIAVMGGSGYYAYALGQNRIEEILDNGPSKIAIAEVSGIETHNGRYTTSYYAVFEYKAGDDIIERTVPEDSETDYIVSQKYQILYSVQHPDMFRIIKKAP